MMPDLIVLSGSERKCWEEILSLPGREFSYSDIKSLKDNEKPIVLRRLMEKGLIERVDRGVYRRMDAVFLRAVDTRYVWAVRVINGIISVVLAVLGQYVAFAVSLLLLALYTYIENYAVVVFPHVVYVKEEAIPVAGVEG